MNTPEKISPDDPRLTLYALGEMDASERAGFEAQLQHDPNARAAVEEIRRTASLLGAALEAEPAPAARPLERTAIIPGWDPQRLDGGNERTRDDFRRGNRLLRFPALYYSVAGLAAAAFAVFFVVRESQSPGGFAKPQMMSADGAVAAAAPPPAPPVPTAMPNYDAAERRAEPAAALASRAKRMALMALEKDYADQFFSTAEQATSSFPLRLGRESYARVREQLQRGERPARASVHVAEMINAFDYAWPPAEAGAPFVTVLEETAAPWSKETRLLRVGVKGAGERGQLVARGARAQVEFNPARVRAWRLVGFERGGETMGVRGLTPGETVRGGDTVTALYEIVPADEPATEGALATLALEYLDPNGSRELRRLTRRLETGGAAFAQASADMKFITAVAAFGLALRESPMQAPIGLAEIARWAEEGAGADAQRRELVELVHAADTFVR
jgi:hypothetical protein